MRAIIESVISRVAAGMAVIAPAGAWSAGKSAAAIAAGSMTSAGVMTSTTKRAAAVGAASTERAAAMGAATAAVGAASATAAVTAALGKSRVRSAGNGCCRKEREEQSQKGGFLHFSNLHRTAAKTGVAGSGTGACPNRLDSREAFRVAQIA